MNIFAAAGIIMLSSYCKTNKDNGGGIIYYYGRAPHTSEGSIPKRMQCILPTR